MDKKSVGFFKKFPPQFWLVVVFEFFERGSYYGMMSFISVYFTDTLNIPKESVGVIKGVIQPLLYFLPIISGAVADRFGYRKILMIAFALLGGGYFLTSQMTSYTAVFIALVIMGFGAGMFKPVISGTIARVTDESNSTQAFGIFYWSINLGAFLFPLFLVPFLKSLNPAYVIIASAICTGSLIIPTALLYKDPVTRDKADKRDQVSLLQTLANAFEIIYSPLVLLSSKMRSSGLLRCLTVFLLLVLLAFSVNSFLKPGAAEVKISDVGLTTGGETVILKVNRNMSLGKDFKVTPPDREKGIPGSIIIYKPDRLDLFGSTLKDEAKNSGIDLSGMDLAGAVSLSSKKITLRFLDDPRINESYKISEETPDRYTVTLNPDLFSESDMTGLHQSLTSIGILKGVGMKDIGDLMKQMKARPFFLLFLLSVIIISLAIIRFRNKGSIYIPAAAIAAIWLLPGLGVLGRIICSIIYLSTMSLLIIDIDDIGKFTDHAKFLLMIVLYSGFWVLYFQMFDSVLWYVQAYVDAGSLNSAINGFLGFFGIRINWFFDVEHVTVINAGVIILLQLVISNIVKNRKALPTMMTGITIATIGMGILAISANIWVFITGIVLFSIGEMTAHPKFISYIGITAPKEKKALYMGYLFLYGVFGSSVGGVVGAKLYVHFVDNLNRPGTLWLIFSGIGVLTIVSLLLYNRFLVKRTV